MDCIDAKRILTDIAPENIRFKRINAALPAPVQESIVERFNAINADRGGRMTNDPSMRVLGYNLDGCLAYSLSNYATFRLYDEGLVSDDLIALPQPELDIQYQGYKSLAISGAILTKDGYWLLGKRNTGRQFPHAWEFCTSGAMKPKAIQDGGNIDFRNPLMDLMAKETGLKPTDVEDVHNIGIYETSVCVEPVYVLKTSLSQSQVSEAFAEKSNDQYTDITFVETEKLPEFMEAHKKIEGGKIGVVSTTYACAPYLALSFEK